jgi:LacI family transcriptional regulator
VAKITDVAALAGVSVGAVSRVLSNDPTVRVGDVTRRRITDAARELQYVPSHAARALRTARSSTIALVAPDVTSAVFADLTAGAEEQASALGLTIVLAHAEQLAGEGQWLERVVDEGRVDGVIVQVPDDSGTDLLAQLARHDLPVVLINSIDGGPLASIVLDDEAGISTAVDHLTSLGHRSIGYIGGTAASFTGMRRRAAFLQSIAHGSLDARPEWMTELGYSGADGRAAAAMILTAPELPTALVVGNLNAALGVLAEIHARQYKVPDDISIVALHDVWYADATWPPITTVRMPLRELGRSAVAALHALERDPEQPPKHRVITDPAPELVVRASTTSPVSRRS